MLNTGPPLYSIIFLSYLVTVLNIFVINPQYWASLLVLTSLYRLADKVKLLHDLWFFPSTCFKASPVNINFKHYFEPQKLCVWISAYNIFSYFMLSVSCKRLRVKNHTLKVVNTSSLPTDLHAVEVCQEWSSGAATMDWLIFKSGRKRHQMSTSWPTPLTTMFQKVRLQKVLMPI